MSAQPIQTEAEATPSIEQLAAEVTAHLESEAKAMRESITTLAAMRSALAKNDSSGLKDALEKQRQHAEASALLTKAREHIKVRIATVTGVNIDDATIAKFADHVDASTRDGLLIRRRKLLQLHREAEAINHGNASLAAQSLALLRYCFARDDDADTTSRYSQSGEIETREINNTIEARA